MACAEGRKYAERSLIDCSICMGSSETIKILPCKHEMCSECLDQLILRETLLCPQCRASFDGDSDFETKEFWNLECSVCSKMKPSEEFNWCVECAQLLCCLCLVRQHESTVHTIQNWDSGVPVIASLKSKLTGNCLQLEDHARQQRLLKKRMSELFDPVLESISKKIVDSRYQEATSLLQAFSLDTKSMSNVTANANTQEVLSIAAKISGIDIKDMLEVPLCLEDPSNFEDSVRSLIHFKPEPNFFDNVKDSKSEELARLLCTNTIQPVTLKKSDLSSILKRLKSNYVDLTRRDLSAALSTFKDLRPMAAEYTLKDGISRPVCALTGTIPVRYKSDMLQIPVRLYLLDTHPYHAPVCYVRPTPDMMIKASSHVDNEGRIYLPYLSEWKHPECDLVGLLQIMVLAFQDCCPVISVVRVSSIKGNGTITFLKNYSNVIYTDSFPAAPRSNNE